MDVSRRCSSIFTFSLLCCGALLASAQAERAASPLTPLAPLSPSSSALSPLQAEPLAQLPLQFEANRGQQPSEVRYIARGGAQTLFLTDREAVLTVRSAKSGAKASVLRMRPSGAAKRQPLGVDKAEGARNFLLGSDPSRWQRNVPSFARVRYNEVYPGVDLVYYGNRRELEYDFVVAPGADASQVRMSVEGAQSARVEGNGDLTLETPAAPVRHLRPVVYQPVGDRRKSVDAEYVLMASNPGAHEIGFKLGDYDRSLPLVIDPVLQSGSYLGGNGADTGFGVALDKKGFIYLCGVTDSTNFPTAGAFQVNQGNEDVFVTKLKKSGKAIVYSTYIGGSAYDGASRIAVDNLGNAYLTGATSSPDFPSIHPVQAAQGGQDTFLTVVNPQGSGLVYSTYIGGSGSETGYGVALDKQRNVYVSGFTNSPDLPLVGSFQGPQGGQDGFFVKVNAAGTAYLRTSYLGGTGNDLAVSCAVDRKGSVYVVGQTASANFPTVNPIQAMQGASDAFVSKFNPAANSLVYSTYLGGSGAETGVGIAVDPKGSAYVTGQTNSADYPNIRAFQGAQGGQDAFVSKLNPAGNALVFSTNLGGSGNENGWGIGVDSKGSCFVSGATASTDFPTVTAFQGDRPGQDAFVVKFKKSGAALLYSTYLGGSGNDTGYNLAIDKKGAVCVTGVTASNDFPTSAPFQGANGGADDAFIVKLK